MPRVSAVSEDGAQVAELESEELRGATPGDVAGGQGDELEGVQFPPEVGEEPLVTGARRGLGGRETAEQAARLVAGLHPEWDDAAKDRFRRHYTDYVGFVLDWVGWEDVQWLMLDGRQLPQWARFGVGVLALAGGAFFLGPDGLRLRGQAGQAVDQAREENMERFAEMVAAGGPPLTAASESEEGGGARAADLALSDDIRFAFDRLAPR